MDRLRKLQIIKEEFQKNLNDANEKQAIRFNLYSRPIKFKVGDKALKIATKLSKKANSKAGKLYDKYIDPYIIERKIPPSVYELKNLKGKHVGEWDIK